MAPLFLIWLFLTLFFVLGEAFFAMQEMAILSYNRLYLNYRLQFRDRRAQWIRYFLLHPHRLFTTILIFNDACLHLGSECSRRFFAALNWPAALAPISQVLLVIVFAELAPMFAARRHPESAAHFGVGLLYPLSRAIGPLNWCIGKLSDAASKCLGIPESDIKRHLLSREDLHALLFSLDDEAGAAETKSFADSAIANLFQQRLATAEEMMQPLAHLPLVRWNASFGAAKRQWLASSADFLLVYQRTHRQIIGALPGKELLWREDSAAVGENLQLPFFASAKTAALDLISQLKIHRKDLAIVLNAEGAAVGYATLQSLQVQLLLGAERELSPKISRVLEKRFSAHVLVRELMSNYGISLPTRQPEELLAEMLEHHLGHLPAKGDLCRINGLEFSVESDGLSGAKSVKVRSLIY